jgi:predicted metal-binding membrane protein
MAPLDRTTNLALLFLAAATAVSWIGLARLPPAMELPGFLAAWTLMMAAMMLPSIAPLVLLYRGSRTALAAGYLLAWGVVGVIPYLAMNWSMTVDPARSAMILAAAGVYELTPLKSACLRHCRTPATFLLQHFQHGALRLGAEHALWCTGCCLGLMAVLVFAAAMDLRWAAAIALIVFAQKVLPLGGASTWPLGIGLIVAAIVVAM